MFLKRRNAIALFLLFLAALCGTFGCWTFGQQIDNHGTSESLNTGGSSSTVTNAHFIDTSDPHTNFTETTVTGTITDTTTVTTQTEMILESTTSKISQSYEVSEETDDSTGKLFGYILLFIAIVFAVTGTIVLYQKKPFFGPDGICMILAVLSVAYHFIFYREYAPSTMITVLRLIAGIVGTFLFLLCVRELTGWILSKFSLSWCLVHRTIKRCPSAQISLLIFVGWIMLPLVGIVGSFRMLSDTNVLKIVSWGLIPKCSAISVSGILCLWKYGADLNHFKKQLDHYQQGKPITVGNGAFSETEIQLLDVQAQHEEAVRTAVASERFKVELISNVSHDLRTPLTSILGYSELLQKETLSPEGQEQLRRLHQKAGYMNDLVESLFELTKVSSGVVECKKDEIDLIRLLEQTIGLVDDQLMTTGLTVKRNYCADSILVATDGARMHQVFANLLGNAIKYALTGTRIYLEVKETENSYYIRMVNTASYEMDFKPDEIMQRFARGDKARSTKGSGLGLAIAGTYTESVGGAFHVAVDGDQFNAIVELPKA